jgi:hypothetical protein
MFLHRHRSHNARGMRSREGFALMLALGALVAIAVLVAGSSYISLQENRLGQNELVQSRAFAMAEYGLNRIQADWNRTPNLQMENGASYDTSYSVAGQGTANVRYTRLNNETFWIVSQGEATVGNSLGKARTAQKRLGAILRLRIPTIKANGAVTVNGTVTTQGNAHIYGWDSSPTDWTGCPPTADKAGITVPSGAQVFRQGSDVIEGNPAIAKTAVAGDTMSYVKYGDETWNTLVAQGINIRDMGPSDIGPDTLDSGACNKSNRGNWGEPWRSGPKYIDACKNYFPILYSDTSLNLTGNGRGQGILLVKGDLVVNGTFEWYGLVIVTDDIQKGNGNAMINGAIMARNDNSLDRTDASGSVSYKYSSCSIEHAMRGSAQVVQAKERAWAELY